MSASPQEQLQTSDISLSSPRASLVALHGPSPDRWPTRRGSMNNAKIEKHMGRGEA